jgi:hypothetical protein
MIDNEIVINVFGGDSLTTYFNLLFKDSKKVREPHN